MYTSITKEQLVNFVLNDVNDEEREKIIEAIDTNSEIKEIYLFEKRKHDVERYIDDKMTIGESCEIEELIKMDSRLYDHFVLNTEANEKEKDASISVMHNSITKKQLIKFVLNDVYDEEYIKEYEKISEAINTSPLTKEIYLFEKRKHDVEKYLDNKMKFEERCEIEELLKINLSLYEYCESIKDLNDKEQNISINGKQIAITKEMLVNFVLNDINDEEREMISEAINTKSLIKERYLFEKRKHDIERYLDDEMTIGESCEMEELIKIDSRLFDYFELNNGVFEEDNDNSPMLKQRNITEEQLVNFVLNNVSEAEHKKISEEINTHPIFKERYLFGKRKHDVERYLENEMDIGERCEMEELLERNPRLQSHFDLNKEINHVLQKTFKDKINNIHDELYNTNPSGRIEDEISLKDTAPVIAFKLNLFKWVAAASIIFMIGFGGRNIYLNNTGSLENRLYAQYYEPINKIQKYSSSTFIEAKKQFENKEYELALLILDEPSKSITSESEKILYQGFILMELKRYDEAIEKFKHLQNINDFEFIKPINNWYLSLCYLKTGENEKVIEQLVKIDDVNGGFYKEAKELLKKLKK
ncbi:MAG: hypothetical protein GQ564_11165 [Bacteroidales bacterium]|nr:hypothetical protein [Bacteroidales bacterium]